MSHRSSDKGRNGNDRANATTVYAAQEKARKDR